MLTTSSSVPSQHALPRWIGRFERSFRIERPKQIGAQLPRQATGLRALHDLAFQIRIQLAQDGSQMPEAPPPNGVGR